MKKMPARPMALPWCGPHLPRNDLLATSPAAQHIRRMADTPRILLIGCGGIGGTVAGHLAELGCDIHPVSRNRKIADAVESNGFRLRGHSDPRSVPGRIHREIPDGPFDWLLLATQPPQVEEAVRQALPALAPDARVVCFQNGLCESRVQPIVGPERPVIGGIIAWGASMPEPGLYDRTSDGGFSIGRYDGEPDPRVDQLAMWLESIGPVAQTRNLAGARWSKLAINSAISSLGTLYGDRLGAVIRLRMARRLALDIMTETVEVARREGVKLEKVAGTLDLDWMALTDEERTQAGSVSLASKHTMILAVGTRFRRLRSSMLSAIERGERGRRHEVPTPVNAAVVDAVWAMSRGELKPGRGLIERVYRETRAGS
jgi:2-dehydropantoate 2-reductase